MLTKSKSVESAKSVGSVGPTIRDCHDLIHQRDVLRQGKLSIAAFATGYSDATAPTDSDTTVFGCWVRVGSTRAILAAPCKSNSRWTAVTDAELCGVYGAVYMAMSLLEEYPGLPRAQNLVVETGSLAVRNWFQGRGLKGTDSYVLERVYWSLRWPLEAHGIKVVVKWAKGHQSPGTGTEAYLSNRVDVLAKEVWRTGQERRWVGHGARPGPARSASA